MSIQKLMIPLIAILVAVAACASTNTVQTCAAWDTDCQQAADEQQAGGEPVTIAPAPPSARTQIASRGLCQPWENCASVASLPEKRDTARANMNPPAGKAPSTEPAPVTLAAVEPGALDTGRRPRVSSLQTGGTTISSRDKRGTEYLIGPGDQINIFVWRNPDVSVTVPVRPDGKISTPLVEDMVAVGKTPSLLARDIEKVLQTYIRDPVVTVIVTGFGGPYSQQIRVIGQATQPKTLPYRENMSLLDVIIAVGGLTEYASGNKATIVRKVEGKQKQIRVRIDDLVKKGDINANVFMRPGDILIIPESWF